MNRIGNLIGPILFSTVLGSAGAGATTVILTAAAENGTASVGEILSACLPVTLFALPIVFGCGLIVGLPSYLVMRDVIRGRLILLLTLGGVMGASSAVILGVVINGLSLIIALPGAVAGVCAALPWHYFHNQLSDESYA